MYYFDRDPTRQKMGKALRHTPNKGGSLGYIIETHRQVTGKFQPKRAIELGVPKGPLFAKLTKGESIEVNGNLITPDMVCEPAPPAPVFAVIDIQDEADLPKFDFSKFQEFMSSNHKLVSVIHMSPT